MKKVYLIAAIISFVLYVAGVLTGIFTERYVSSSALKEVETLKGSMASMQTDMENLQLQQLYLSVVGEEKSCPFLVSSVSQLEKELTIFWGKLPKRLEEFERYGTITKEYEELKKDYTFVLLRTWMLSTDLRDRCDKTIVPILYFYSKDCNECSDFGLVLDNAKSEQETKDVRVMVFTVDLYMNEPIVNIIKDTHSITYAPSIIINKEVYKGVLSEEEIGKIIESL